MGVWNVAPNGYGPSYAGNSSPGVYATLTGMPQAAPAANSAYAPTYAPASGYGSAYPSASPYIPYAATQSAPPLIQSPSTYQNGPGYSSESNPPFGIMGQDTSSGTSKQKKHSNYIVFYATMMAYGSLLGGALSILTFPGLSRYRGRASKFTYNEKADSKNGVERKNRKVAAFDSELSHHNRVKTARDETKAPEALPKPKISNHADIEKRYVTTSREAIEHKGYWEKVQSSKLQAEVAHSEDGVHIGFHAKGATLMGQKVTHDGGVLSIAVPAHDNAPLEATLQRHLGAVGVAPESIVKSSQQPVVISDKHGVHALEHVQIPLPAKGGREQLESILKAIDVKPEDLKKELVRKNRIASGDELTQPREWHEQFEMQKKTPFATAGPKQRALGQVVGRLKEYAQGCLDAWKNPYDGGNRIGLMVLSSTTLTALLAFTAASVALGMSESSDKHQQQQNAQNLTLTQ